MWLLLDRRANVALDATNREKGTEFLRKIYGSKRLETMFKPWGANFEWLTKDIVYGLFHADERVFGTLEAERRNSSRTRPLHIKGSAQLSRTIWGVCTEWDGVSRRLKA